MSHLLLSSFRDLNPKFDVIEEVCDKIIHETGIHNIALKRSFKPKLTLVDLKSPTIPDKIVEENYFNKYSSNENFKILNEMLTAANRAKRLVRSLKN